MTKDDMETLTAVGLGPDEVFDLILSSALFGWANRLMHTLGDPTEITD
jgi:alkylhydroperoxidase family enzyme